MSVFPARFADQPLPAKSRSARLLWAMLMSLFAAGLGQIYLGRFRSGIRLVAADLALDLAGTVVMHRAPSAHGLVLMAFVLLCILSLRITAIVLVARGGAPADSLRKPAIWQTAWLVFLVVLGVTRAASVALPQGLRSFAIPSGAMIPTLRIGDLVFAATAAVPPARGEVVYFHTVADGETFFVKRVIALPGDRVQLQAGQVILNGQPVARAAAPPLSDPIKGVVFTESLPGGRSYAVLKSDAQGPLDDTPEVTVPQGSLFVLGDNRDNSQDSRLAAFGFVPIAQVVAHDGVIYWAQDRARLLGRVR